MGMDKATVLFRGRPMIEHALGVLHAAGLPVLIAGARDDLKSFAPVVNDLAASQGPLGGICGALQATSVTRAVFIPVDLPCLPASLITSLHQIAQAAGSAVVVPSVNGFAQTFPAVIDRRAQPALEAELAAGRRGCFSAFQAAAAIRGEKVHVVATELLAQSGQVTHPDGIPPARWLFNINSAADLKHADTFSRSGHTQGSHRVS